MFDFTKSTAMAWAVEDVSTRTYTTVTIDNDGVLTPVFVNIKSKKIAQAQAEITNIVFNMISKIYSKPVA